ncbi:TPM domain-containing protein [Bartonella sp. F02]|uniref:TPM domain-containing protein n=1 Tax=Bartonella sp. F02 TaxID=2967262 RepID=UPI0022A96F27|nr:TPM domain-containing protein [Bartonella sp. F02]MCZ2328212.1 TPM domain-containing protein [Bartonella sp. F02]
MTSVRHPIRRNIFPHLLALMGLLWMITLHDVAYSQSQFPLLTGHINDTAHLLDHATIRDLTEKLTEIEEKSGDQIVVVTIPTLSGMDIETYSNFLFRKWALGQKQINNGVLLIVAPNEHAVRIEVGYGLEGELTDAISSIIINNYLLPHFREKNYQKGIIEAINIITNIITKNDSEFSFRIKAQAKNIEIQRKQTEKEKMIADAVIFLIFFIMIGLPILAMFFGEKISPRKYRWLGITFTLWFIGLNSTSRRYGRKFNQFPSDRRFKGGGGSSGGGGASGRW